jgi:hypothetical protein
MAVISAEKSLDVGEGYSVPLADVEGQTAPRRVARAVSGTSRWSVCPSSATSRAATSRPPTNGRGGG